MSNIIAFVLCFLLLPLSLLGLLGLFLGWLFSRGKKVEGDLSVEGEAALRAEADSLRARIQELEGRVTTRDTEISGLKGKLATAAAAAAAGAAVTAAPAAAAASKDASDDDTYALEWRNRYLAARVKYLESQVAEAPKPVAKKAPAKSKASPKPKAKTAPKPKAKAAPKPKVLYTDGPTDGAPDDLKLIKGIGPKFEKDLNGKGIYYFRQIAAWKKKDVTMVEGVIDSFPGRIDRDEWIKQAKGLAKSNTATATKASAGRKKPGPKPGTKRGALTASGKPRQKPGPKKGSTRTSKKMSDADAAFEKYYTNVKKYDPKARKPVVQGIVKYCGIALRTRDGSLVACSDEAELKTVADGYVTKKLQKQSGQMELVKEVCQDMKGERFKSRVTFYYLAAKKARKLGLFT
jgi:predicted flap endonuclease-1-like 5' DNA nuclease